MSKAEVQCGDLEDSALGTSVDVAASLLTLPAVFPLRGLWLRKLRSSLGTLGGVCSASCCCCLSCCTAAIMSGVTPSGTISESGCFLYCAKIPLGVGALRCLSNCLSRVWSATLGCWLVHLTELCALCCGSWGVGCRAGAVWKQEGGTGGVSRSEWMTMLIWSSFCDGPGSPAEP